MEPMLQWILMAAMTAVASLAVLVPLGRRPADAEGSARSIYRDQLNELELERERGLIGEREAEAARIELSRRLLRPDATRSTAEGGGRRAVIAGFIVAAILLPAIALGTYLSLGSPATPDQPLASRSTVSADADIATLIGKVEQHLRDDPGAGAGWELLGPVYLKLGRFDDAVRAYGNAIRILGSTADREALLGEALTSQAGGLVTSDAKAAFDRALRLDSKNDRAAFYEAVAVGQTGDKDAAIAAWKTLIAGAPADAPWLPVAQAELRRVENPAPGPNAADMAAAAGQSAGEQQAMIEGMVSGLAARLDGAPEDVDGWARLFRAYMVLGKPDEATAALARARTALAGKPDLLAQVEKAAADNGVGAPKP
ncbi:cytochrome c-type biogenesis protein CcmH [Kaistia soli DSM 19436]|uniref:Cytochrome c-type biogenesis protein CcmH n=2 Tax=Kaistia TaxID=166953 RepID=A0A1M4UVT7_9HYPH|nr:cytochrome c-type biogenesis protein CcmH [Kaistia soli DSM 19436]